MFNGLRELFRSTLLQAYKERLPNTPEQHLEFAAEAAAHTSTAQFISSMVDNIELLIPLAKAETLADLHQIMRPSVSFETFYAEQLEDARSSRDEIIAEKSPTLRVVR
jgi:hypothetical protein